MCNLQVERTRNRPLAAGTVTPTQAVGELQRTLLLLLLLWGMQHDMPPALPYCLPLLAADCSACRCYPFVVQLSHLMPLIRPPPTAFLAAQLSAGLAILLQLNPYSQVGGAACVRALRVRLAVCGGRAGALVAACCAGPATA